MKEGFDGYHAVIGSADCSCLPSRGAWSFVCNFMATTRISSTKPFFSPGRRDAGPGGPCMRGGRRGGVPGADGDVRHFETRACVCAESAGRKGGTKQGAMATCCGGGCGQKGGAEGK